MIFSCVFFFLVNYYFCGKRNTTTAIFLLFYQVEKVLIEFSVSINTQPWSGSIFKLLARSGSLQENGSVHFWPVPAAKKLFYRRKKYLSLKFNFFQPTGLFILFLILLLTNFLLLLSRYRQLLTAEKLVYLLNSFFLCSAGKLPVFL